MLKTASNHYADGSSQGPSNYDFDSANIVLRDGTEIDITSIIAKIKIVESIRRIATLVNITIVDTADYIDLLKIDGTEKINFVITRKEPDQEIKKFEREVVVAEIKDYKRINPGTLAYTLSCIPEFAYINQYKTISKYVSGSFKKNIKSICTGDLGLSNKDLEISEDGVSFNSVIPLMKPIFAINWLLFRVYDNKPFFNKERPIPEDSEDIKMEYFEELQKKIARDRSDIKMSKYYSGAEGSYGATVHHIDIAEKIYDTTVYEFKNKNLLNENPPLAQDSKIGNKKIESYSEGKNYFINKNSLAFGSGDNYHTNVTSESLAEMNSHKALNDTTAQRFEIPGDFDLHAGAVIELELLRVAEIEDTINNESELLSGKHLVTTIEHLFEPSGYTMIVSAKKDSFIKTLDERKVANE